MLARHDSDVLWNGHNRRWLNKEDLQVGRVRQVQGIGIVGPTRLSRVESPIPIDIKKRSAPYPLHWEAHPD